MTGSSVETVDSTGKVCKVNIKTNKGEESNQLQTLYYLQLVLLLTLKI